MANRKSFGKLRTLRRRTLSKVEVPSIADKKDTLVFIVGPTAVGKTEVAMKLARRLDAEIISCDSMQVYKKMNIITQKPSGIEKRKVRHHLIGVVSPEKEYNVADYQKQAVLKIKDILRRGKVPLFVGGTGFYVSVLLDGIFQEDVKKRKIRARLYREAAEYGRKKLYRRLVKVDPQAAGKIHPHDLRRLVRALEVYENTGVPISELQQRRKGLSNDYRVKIFCLNRNRQELYRRIEQRVEEMFKTGLLKEVKNLLALRLSKTAAQAIGIKEIKGYLDGCYDLEEAKRLIKRNSRRYAKRQLSWFRRDKRIKWIKIKRAEKTSGVQQRLWKELS